MSRTSGMTIVEGTIVLAILLLLAAISVPALFHNRHRRDAAACALNLDAIAAASRQHAQEKGRFPKTVDQLVPDYLIILPVCPEGGHYSLGSPEGDPPSCSVSGHHL